MSLPNPILSSVDGAAQKIIDLLSRLIGFDTIFIATNDGESNHILKSFNRGKPLVEEGQTLPIHEVYCSLIPDKPDSFFILTSTQAHLAASSMGITKQLGDHSFVGAPIHLTDGRLYGMLCAMDEAGYQIKDNEVQALKTMAMLMAYVMELENISKNDARTNTKLKQEIAATEGLYEKLRIHSSLTEEKLERNSDLMSMLSHEIRNSLNGVVGITELLQQSNMTEDQKMFLDLIETSNANLMDLLNNILDFSKLEAGRMVIEKQPIDLLSAIEDSAFLFAGKASEKGQEIVLDMGSEIPILYGDAAKLRQVVLNLLSNAVKFTPSGTIVLTTEAEPDAEERMRVFISVQDTGIGMNPAQLKSLFAPFSQVHEFASEGTGLGLSISRQLMELMGGRLLATSTPGKGSRFTLELTLDSEPANTVPNASNTLFANKNVLIVDDNIISTETLAAMCRRWGLGVYSTSNLEQASQWLSSKIPLHAVIMDSILGSTKGADFLEQQVAASGRELPAILMVPIGTRAVLPEGFKGSLISKPIRRLHLANALTSLFLLS